MYIKRNLEEKIGRYLDSPEIIAVVGPRQAGKTTLLRRFQADMPQSIFLTFEDIELRLLFEEDIKGFSQLYVQPYRQIFIDEFQYVKKGGRLLKYLYDTNPGKKFFISGSSSIDLTIEGLSFLAGRIFVFHLLPFDYREFLRGIDPELAGYFEENSTFSRTVLGKLNRALVQYLQFGGYPRVVTAEDLEEKTEVLKNLLNTYLLRDLKDASSIAEERVMYKLLKALALQTGSIIKYNELAELSGLTINRLKKALGTLEGLLLIRLLPPFFTNKRLEIVKNPKVFFLDSGLRNILLGDFRAPDSRPDKGALYENFVFSCLEGRVYQGDIEEVRYYRAKSGAEVDFVLNGRIPVEVKSAVKKPAVSKSMRSFLTRYRPEAAFVLNQNLYHRQQIEGTTVSFMPHVHAAKAEALSP